MTLIDAAIGLLLVPSPVFVVSGPLAFIDAIIAVEHHTMSLPFVINYLAVVGSLSVLLDFEVLGGVECMDVDDVRPRTIGLEPRKNVLVSHLAGYGPQVGVQHARLAFFSFVELCQMCPIERHMSY